MNELLRDEMYLGTADDERIGFVSAQQLSQDGETLARIGILFDRVNQIVMNTILFGFIWEDEAALQGFPAFVILE